MKDPRSDIREIFDAGLQAANPGEAIRRTVSLMGERLEVNAGPTI